MSESLFKNINPKSTEPDIPESLKFWRSLDSKRKQPPKFLAWQSPVWLIMLGSIAAHVAFWLLLPNPIKRNAILPNPPKVSIIPVVNVPPELLLRSKPRLPQQLSSLNLNQINLPTISQPNYNPSLPPPLLSVLPQDIPSSSNLIVVSNASNLNSNLAINNKQSNLNIPLGNNNLKPEITETPAKPTEKAPNPSNKPSPKPSEPPTPINPITGYSYKASDLIAANNLKKPINSDLGGVLSQYGADKVVQRQIASPDTPVAPDKREPIDWIPIEPQAGISGSVAFVLVVSPDGRVEQEPIVSESTNPKLEQIARETIKGYYNKFKPIEQAKYRLVRIHYKIP